MYIEKDVCDGILGTILNVNGKSKYGLTSCKIFLYGYEKDLHNQELKGNVYYIPAA